VALPSPAPAPRYGGIGGLSEVLGWTEVQRDDKGSEGALGGLTGVIKVGRELHALCGRRAFEAVGGAA